VREAVQRALDAGLDFAAQGARAEELASLDDKAAGDWVDVLPIVRALASSAAVQRILADVGSFQIPDSTPIFLRDLDRFASADFLPTDMDIILSRVQTTSITEYHFRIDNTPFRFIDVAGQRSQRRKWIHFFENVTAMLFVASLSCYNMPLREDTSVNAMEDQLQLFDSMINGKWFRDTNVILFLNKRDLFEKKIERVPLTLCFPEYDGGSLAEPAMDYISLQFQKRKKTADKVVYIHFTCATNTDNVAVVFRAVREIILRSSLRYD